MPTISMREGDEDYAISFAVPTDAKGITLISAVSPATPARLKSTTTSTLATRYTAATKFSLSSTTYSFRTNRIFLNGEVEFAGMIVERFAGYHRQSYGGCKVGVGDVLIGATALAGDMAGSAKAIPR